jgi:predicted nucleic acid-binding protein
VIVLDASAVIDFILALHPHSARITARVRAEAPNLAAPHLVDAEVAQVLRRFVRSGQVAPARAEQAIDDLGALPLTRYPHGLLLRRAFGLRDNVTIYDGLYLALAEALTAPLLTRDAALASVPGCRARVDVVA